MYPKQQVSNGDVRHRVLGADVRPLTEAVALCRLKWLRQALRMPAHRLPFYGLFGRAGEGLRKRR